MTTQRAARARRWTRRANGLTAIAYRSEPRADWMPRKPLTAARAWRLERAVHRRFMRRSAIRGALDTTDPRYQLAAQLADEAYATAKAVRRIVWGPLA